MKRKILFSLISVALLLVIAVCTLVACDDPAEKYSVTFKNGDDIVSTLSDIEKGTALKSEQIPTLSNIPEDKEFAGWYIGEGADAIKVEAGYIVNGNVTAIAKLNDKQAEEPDTFTVIFKNGNDVVDTLENVVDGTTLTANQIPTLTDIPADKIFKGWYVGEGASAVKVDVGYEVTSDVTAVAKFEDKARFTVTFKNGDTVIDTLENIIDGTALTANQIPTLTNIPSFKKFNGWYVGEGASAIKVEEGYVVTDDLIVVAKVGLIVTIDDAYIGKWDKATGWETYHLTATKDSFSLTYNGEECEITDFIELPNDGYSFKYIFNNNTVDGKLFFENDELYFYNSYNNSNYALVKSGTVLEDMLGKWYYTYYSGEDLVYVVVTVSEDNFIIGGQTVAIADMDTRLDMNGHPYWKFTIGTDKYELAESWGDYTIAINEGIEKTLNKAADTITITFKESSSYESEVYKTVEIEFGGTISASDIPGNPEKEGSTFVKWQVAEGYPYPDLTEEYVFYKDMTIIAVWEANEA